jgi:hypothetical protein
MIQFSKFKVGDIISYTGKYGGHFAGYTYLVFKVVDEAPHYYKLELLKFKIKNDCYFESIDKISIERINLIDHNFKIDMNEKLIYYIDNYL